MNDDLMRFNSETGEEARYWFCLSDFVDLSLTHGLDKMLADMLQLRDRRLKELDGLTREEGC
jgi:hypothetical protein